MRRDACPRPDARAPSSVVTCARLSCATRRRVCDPRRLTQPASQPRPRSFPRAQLRARRQAHAQYGARNGEVRRRRPPACGMWAPAREPRAYGASQGREIHHHPTSQHAGVYVRAQHAAAGGPPRATELATSEQARRLVRAGPSRELRGIAPGGRQEARAVTTFEYDSSTGTGSSRLRLIAFSKAAQPRSSEKNAASRAG